jgi:putative DNA primase/helicase
MIPADADQGIAEQEPTPTMPEHPGEGNGTVHHLKRVGETRNLTDLGNGERFVDDHRRYARYSYRWNRWLIFDGMRWAIDDGGDVEHLMKKTVRGIYAEAAMETDEAQRKQIADHARRSEGRKRQTDALLLARSELAIRPEEMDRDPYLLNCANGTVDLKTGVLRPHAPLDYITKLAPIHYHVSTKAPTFEAFLERILPSKELRLYVQVVIGYAAIGVNTEEMLPIFYGFGANGKSTLVNVVMEALGDYAQQAAPDLLMAKHRSHPTELADLFGARFVAAVETDEGRRLNEGLVKQLTGRDKIKARRMNEDFWEFNPTHTPVLATNHKPEVGGTDHAIWRRLKLVPFGVQIPDKEQDKKLAEKLREELPGVLAWIVRGALIYQKVGLPETAQVRDATTGYREEMDTLAGFFEARCVIHPNASAGATPLYNAYKEWCDEGGETRLTQTRFGRQLRERGFSNKKAQTVTWYGIGLRDDRPDPDRRGRPDQGDVVDSSEPDKDREAGAEDAQQGGNRLKVDSLDPNRLSGKCGIDKGNAADVGRGLRGFRPENGIKCQANSPEGCNSEKGSKPSKPLKLSTDTLPERRLSAEETERVKRLIAEGMAPEWARAEVLGDEAGAA